MKFLVFEEYSFLLLLHGNILKRNDTYSNENEKKKKKKKKKLSYWTF